MNKIIGKINALILSALMIVSGTAAVTGVFNTNRLTAMAADDTIILRVCNWEEYIDTGDWSDDDTIDLESGSIKGENSIITDFENWYYENYGKKVKVQYSCLGTNEELYNMLTLGDDYDVICPSEYMIMKLMAEDWLEPFSDDFYDTSIANNYYAKGVSPFIKKTFDENKINGESWSRYAAGYMWGITGIVYNPDKVTSQSIQIQILRIANRCQHTSKIRSYRLQYNYWYHKLLPATLLKHHYCKWDKCYKRHIICYNHAAKEIQSYKDCNKLPHFSCSCKKGMSDFSKIPFCI